MTVSGSDLRITRGSVQSVPTEKCYACIHVLLATRAVLYIAREDNDLILACGAEDHAQTTHDWRVIHRSHLLEADDTIAEVADLNDGEQAERVAVGEPWRRGPLTD